MENEQILKKERDRIIDGIDFLVGLKYFRRKDLIKDIKDWVNNEE